MKILITGATGFIGRNLVSRLCKEKKFFITALVRRSSKVNFLKEKNINLIYADITKKETLDIINENFDVIYHCAGFVGEKPPELLYRVNVLGTKNICEFALKKGVKKFIHVSSVAVINGNEERPLRDDMPYRPVTPYGISKMESKD